jgi:hypothetical protein
MLLPLLEDANRNTTVRVGQPTLAMVFIIFEEAIVFLAIFECKYSLPTHPIVLPLTLVSLHPLPMV